MAKVTINSRSLSLWMRDNLAKSVGAEMSAVANEIASEIRQNNDIGSIAGSVRVEKQNVGAYNVRYKITTDSPHAGYVNEGTGPSHVDPYGEPAPRSPWITFPKRGGVLVFDPVSGSARGGSNFVVFAKKAVHTLGQKPKLFMKTAFDRVSSRHSGLFGRKR